MSLAVGSMAVGSTIWTGDVAGMSVVGILLGNADGVADGVPTGPADGTNDGIPVDGGGDGAGLTVGCADEVGAADAMSVGSPEGCALAVTVGSADGIAVGAVGMLLGAVLGARV